MERVSIEDAYLWAQRFIMREWRLLLPVALAFLALPPLAAELLIPPSVLQNVVPTPQNPTPAGFAAAALWLIPVSLTVTLFSLVGSLVILALTLMPAISVREAIVHGFRRLPTLFVAGLLIALAAMVVTIVLVIIMVAIRIPLIQQRALLMGIMFGVGIFVGLRLLALGPLIVERRIGARAAIRLSWELTQGVFWRLAAGLGIYVVGGMVVLLALRSAIGVVVLLLAKLAGVPDVGVAIDATLYNAGTAVFSAGLQILVAAFYRQLAGSSSGT